MPTTRPNNTQATAETATTILTDAVRDEVVRLYRSGVKCDDITKATGVKRPTIFYVLQQRGITPSRQRTSRSEVTVDAVLQELNAAQREIGRLEAENELLQRECERLKARKR